MEVNVKKVIVVYYMLFIECDDIFNGWVMRGKWFVKKKNFNNIDIKIWFECR